MTSKDKDGIIQNIMSTNTFLLSEVDRRDKYIMKLEQALLEAHNELKRYQGMEQHKPTDTSEN